MTLLLVGCIKVGMNTTLDATILHCYYWQCPVSSSRLGLSVYGSIQLHLFWLVSFFFRIFLFSFFLFFSFLLFLYKTLEIALCFHDSTSVINSGPDSQVKLRHRYLSPLGDVGDTSGITRSARPWSQGNLE